MGEEEAAAVPVVYGGLVLNQDRSKVVVVKSQGGAWNFPCGNSIEVPEPVAAATIIKQQTGLAVEDIVLSEPILTTTEPGSGVKLWLYIAAGVEEGGLSPDAESGVESADWIAVEDILGADASDSEHAYAHYVPDVVDHLQRHPDILFPEPDRELAAVIIYDSAKWAGPSPKQHLMEYCEQNELPAPCFNFFFRNKQQQPNRKQLISCTCILSHLGVQVTPERAALFPRDAEEAAALHALLYLEGAITPMFPYCRITPVGFLPTLIPRAIQPILSPEEEAAKRTERFQKEKERLLRDIEAREKMLSEELAEVQRQKAALEEGGDMAADLIARVKRLQAWDGPGPLAHMHEPVLWAGAPAARPRPTKRARTAIPGTSAAVAQAAAGVAAIPVKNSIQEVKEFCDRQRGWTQPEYTYTKDDFGKFLCTVTLTCSGLDPITSSAEATQRSAKGVAATMLMQELSGLPLQDS